MFQCLLQAVLFTDFVTAKVGSCCCFDCWWWFLSKDGCGRHTVGDYICPPPFPVCGSDISRTGSLSRQHIEHDRAHWSLTAMMIVSLFFLLILKGKFHYFCTMHAAYHLIQLRNTVFALTSKIFFSVRQWLMLASSSYQLTTVN